MRSLFFTKPLFLFLIPAFFCFHALQEYFGFISASDFLLLLSIYIIVSYLLYLFIRVSLKNAWKAALFVFVLQLIFFFFSSLHFWLIKISQNGLISKRS
ncbi:MAG TPA: hypothetical protein VFN30_05325 [Chitinophagaceae bacterium]|nr:hypothetical protein [Chitinophagaceae bacterium]